MCGKGSIWISSILYSRFTVVLLPYHVLGEAAAEPPRGEADGQDEHRQHERRGVAALLDFGEGGGQLEEDGEGQRGHGLEQGVGEEVRVAGREENGGGVSDATSEGR